MPCGEKRVTVRAKFQEIVDCNVSFRRSRSRFDTNISSGKIVAKVNRFNPANDRMQGTTLMEKDEEEWLWEVEGDPDLIPRRLGGNAKRSRERSSDDDDGEEENRAVGRAPQMVDSTEIDMADPQQDTETTPVVTTIQETRSPKRIRRSGPSRLDPLPMPIDSLDVGPSQNTRSRAAVHPGRGGAHKPSTSMTTRKGAASVARSKANPAGPKGKGKFKRADDRDQVAEITAGIEGIDGFSVFTNRQIDHEPTNGFMTLNPAPKQAEPQGINAVDWVTPVGHQVKVGLWLEETVQAGPQASVNAPKSKAPSSVFGDL